MKDVDSLKKNLFQENVLHKKHWPCVGMSTDRPIILISNLASVYVKFLSFSFFLGRT